MARRSKVYQSSMRRLEVTRYNFVNDVLSHEGLVKQNQAVLSMLEKSSLSAVKVSHEMLMCRRDCHCITTRLLESKRKHDRRLSQTPSPSRRLHAGGIVEYQ
jgi:hypothetical protein